MSIHKQSLSAMIETLPTFSGNDKPGTVGWLEFQIAMDQMELHNFNKTDAVIQFLNKIQEPAKILISSKDKDTSVKDIFQKLKAVYGTPKFFFVKSHSGPLQNWKHPRNRNGKDISNTFPASGPNRQD